MSHFGRFACSRAGVAAAAILTVGHLVLPASACAQQGGLAVVLLPPSGLNIAPEILDAARDILKDHLQRTGRYSVIAPAGAPTTDEPTPAMTVQQAAATGASQAMVLRITHLGTSTRVRLTVYAAGSGQVVYWDSMSVKGGPSDLDVALQRLVSALLKGVPVRDSADLETVTDDETTSLNRRTANKTFGVELFAMLPLDTPDGKFRTVPGFGLFWMYDARSWMADVALELGGHGSAHVFDLSLGAYYPFIRSDFTPYLGGVVKYGAVSLGGTGSSGLVLEPTLGMLLGRLSSVQMRAQVGYFVDTFTEAPIGATGDGAGSAREHLGHGFVLTVGLGF